MTRMRQANSGSVRSAIGTLEEDSDTLIEIIDKLSQFHARPVNSLSPSKHILLIYLAAKREIDWPSAEDTAMQNWLKTEASNEVREKLKDAFKYEGIKSSLFDLRTSIVEVCNAPIVYLAIYWVSVESKNDIVEFEKAFDTVVYNSFGKGANPTFGICSGWQRDDVEHESFGEGNKRKIFVALIGWDSTEHHRDWVKQQNFAKEDIAQMGKMVKHHMDVSVQPPFLGLVANMFLVSIMRRFRRNPEPGRVTKRTGI